MKYLIILLIFGSVFITACSEDKASVDGDNNLIVDSDLALDDADSVVEEKHDKDDSDSSNTDFERIVEPVQIVIEFI